MSNIIVIPCVYCNTVGIIITFCGLQSILREGYYEKHGHPSEKYTFI